MLSNPGRQIRVSELVAPAEQTSWDPLYTRACIVGANDPVLPWRCKVEVNGLTTTAGKITSTPAPASAPPSLWMGHQLRVHKLLLRVPKLLHVLASHGKIFFPPPDLYELSDDSQRSLPSAVST